MLFVTPRITRTSVVETLGTSRPTAGRLIERFCELGILVDVTPNRKRDKVYSFNDYLDILEVGT